MNKKLLNKKILTTLSALALTSVPLTILSANTNEKNEIFYKKELVTNDAIIAIQKIKNNFSWINAKTRNEIIESIKYYFVDFNENIDATFLDKNANISLTWIIKTWKKALNQKLANQENSLTDAIVAWGKKEFKSLNKPWFNVYFKNLVNNAIDTHLYKKSTDTPANVLIKVNEKIAFSSIALKQVNQTYENIDTLVKEFQTFKADKNFGLCKKDDIEKLEELENVFTRKKAGRSNELAWFYAPNPTNELEVNEFNKKVKTLFVDLKEGLPRAKIGARSVSVWKDRLLDKLNNCHFIEPTFKANMLQEVANVHTKPWPEDEIMKMETRFLEHFKAQIKKNLIYLNEAQVTYITKDITWDYDKNGYNKKWSELASLNNIMKIANDKAIEYREIIKTPRYTEASDFRKQNYDAVYQNMIENRYMNWHQVNWYINWYGTCYIGLNGDANLTNAKNDAKNQIVSPLLDDVKKQAYKDKIDNQVTRGDIEKILVDYKNEIANIIAPLKDELIRNINVSVWIEAGKRDELIQKVNNTDDFGINKLYEEVFDESRWHLFKFLNDKDLPNLNANQLKSFKDTLPLYSEGSLSKLIDTLGVAYKTSRELDQMMEKLLNERALYGQVIKSKDFIEDTAKKQKAYIQAYNASFFDDNKNEAEVKAIYDNLLKARTALDGIYDQLAIDKNALIEKIKATKWTTPETKDTLIARVNSATEENFNDIKNEIILAFTTTLKSEVQKLSNLKVEQVAALNSKVIQSEDINPLNNLYDEALKLNKAMQDLQTLISDSDAEKIKQNYIDANDLLKENFDNVLIEAQNTKSENLADIENIIFRLTSAKNLLDGDKRILSKKEELKAKVASEDFEIIDNANKTKFTQDIDSQTTLAQLTTFEKSIDKLIQENVNKIKETLNQNIQKATWLNTENKNQATQQATKITNKNFKAIRNQIIEASKEDLNKQIQALTNLNQAQKDAIKAEVAAEIKVVELVKFFDKSNALNGTMKTLNDLKATCQDVYKTSNFKDAELQKQNDFINAHNALNFEDNKDKVAVETLINTLNNAKDALNGDAKILEAKNSLTTEITNDEFLKTSEKNDLKNRLTLAKSLAEINEIKNEKIKLSDKNKEYLNNKKQEITSKINQVESIDVATKPTLLSKVENATIETIDNVIVEINETIASKTKEEITKLTYLNDAQKDYFKGITLPQTEANELNLTLQKAKYLDNLMKQVKELKDSNTNTNTTTNYLDSENNIKAEYDAAYNNLTFADAKNKVKVQTIIDNFNKAKNALNGDARISAKKEELKAKVQAEDELIIDAAKKQELTQKVEQKTSLADLALVENEIENAIQTGIDKVRQDLKQKIQKMAWAEAQIKNQLDAKVDSLTNKNFKATTDEIVTTAKQTLQAKVDTLPNLNEAQKQALKDKISLKKTIAEFVICYEEANNLEVSMKTLNETKTNNLNVKDTQNFKDADLEKQKCFEEAYNALTFIDNKDKVAVDALVQKLNDARNALNGTQKLNDEKAKLTQEINNDELLKDDQKNTLKSQVTTATSLQQLEEIRHEQARLNSANQIALDNKKEEILNNLRQVKAIEEVDKEPLNLKVQNAKLNTIDTVEDEIKEQIKLAYEAKIGALTYLNPAQKAGLKAQVIKGLPATSLNKILDDTQLLELSMQDLKQIKDAYKDVKTTHVYTNDTPAKKEAFDLAYAALDFVDNKDKASVDLLIKNVREAKEALSGLSTLEQAKIDLTNEITNNSKLSNEQKDALKLKVNDATKLQDLDPIKAEIKSLEELRDKKDELISKINETKWTSTVEKQAAIDKLETATSTNIDQIKNEVKNDLVVILETKIAADKNLNAKQIETFKTQIDTTVLVSILNETYTITIPTLSQVMKELNDVVSQAEAEKAKQNYLDSTLNIKQDFDDKLNLAKTIETITLTEVNQIKDDLVVAIQNLDGDKNIASEKEKLEAKIFAEDKEIIDFAKKQEFKQKVDTATSLATLTTINQEVDEFINQKVSEIKNNLKTEITKISWIDDKTTLNQKVDTITNKNFKNITLEVISEAKTKLNEKIDSLANLNDNQKLALKEKANLKLNIDDLVLVLEEADALNLSMQKLNEAKIESLTIINSQNFKDSDLDLQTEFENAKSALEFNDNKDKPSVDNLVKNYEEAKAKLNGEAKLNEEKAKLTTLINDDSLLTSSQKDDLKQKIASAKNLDDLKKIINEKDALNQSNKKVLDDKKQALKDKISNTNAIGQIEKLSLNEKVENATADTISAIESEVNLGIAKIVIDEFNKLVNLNAKQKEYYTTLDLSLKTSNELNQLINDAKALDSKMKELNDLKEESKNVKTTINYLEADNTKLNNFDVSQKALEFVDNKDINAVEKLIQDYKLTLAALDGETRVNAKKAEIKSLISSETDFVLSVDKKNEFNNKTDLTNSIANLSLIEQELKSFIETKVNEIKDEIKANIQEAKWLSENEKVTQNQKVDSITNKNAHPIKDEVYAELRTKLIAKLDTIENINDKQKEYFKSKVPADISLDFTSVHTIINDANSLSGAMLSLAQEKAKADLVKTSSNYLKASLDKKEAYDKALANATFDDAKNKLQVFSLIGDLQDARKKLDGLNNLLKEEIKNLINELDDFKWMDNEIKLQITTKLQEITLDNQDQVKDEITKLIENDLKETIQNLPSLNQEQKDKLKAKVFGKNPIELNQIYDEAIALDKVMQNLRIALEDLTSILIKANALQDEKEVKTSLEKLNTLLQKADNLNNINDQLVRDIEDETSNLVNAIKQEYNTKIDSNENLTKVQKDYFKSLLAKAKDDKDITRALNDSNSVNEQMKKLKDLYNLLQVKRDSIKYEPNFDDIENEAKEILALDGKQDLNQENDERQIKDLIEKTQPILDALKTHEKEEKVEPKKFKFTLREATILAIAGNGVLLLAMLILAMTKPKRKAKK
ncbi:chromosome segregation ATPase [Metamycoplasma subdolum]|uniref:Chromosome segregation ATPase n=1 Tax=Metamycoplasma subdolum TaxID=92407 RepID=A0A3M0AHA6_9BACT|nr:GA module-containing protein [Metamycoplasma subdolum]RMA78612.1 chromosome segregation ATPase [Metamycoplasma subdolum]WPB50786.1 GA module-containing protein [Metamycoplasma subdolum]